MWHRIPSVIRFSIVCCISIALAYSQNWATWSVILAGIIGFIGLARVVADLAMKGLSRKLAGMTPEERDKVLVGMTPEKRRALLVEYGLSEESPPNQ